MARQRYQRSVLSEKRLMIFIKLFIIIVVSYKDYFVRMNPRKYVASRGRADRSGGRRSWRLREHDPVLYRPATLTRGFWGRLGLWTGVKVTLRATERLFVLGTTRQALNNARIRAHCGHKTFVLTLLAYSFRNTQTFCVKRV